MSTTGASKKENCGIVTDIESLNLAAPILSFLPKITNGL